MKTLLVLLIFVLAISYVEADSYSSSTASAIGYTGDIGGIIRSQIPVVSASTATETFTTGEATAIAVAISEAVATNAAGIVVEDSSQSSSISVNGQTLNNPASAIVDKIKEEIKDLQMSV